MTCILIKSRSVKSHANNLVAVTPRSLTLDDLTGLRDEVGYNLEVEASKEKRPAYSWKSREEAINALSKAFGVNFTIFSPDPQYLSIFSPDFCIWV